MSWLQKLFEPPTPINVGDTIKVVDADVFDIGTASLIGKTFKVIGDRDEEWPNHYLIDLNDGVRIYHGNVKYFENKSE